MGVLKSLLPASISQGELWMLVACLLVILVVVTSVLRPAVRRRRRHR